MNHMSDVERQTRELFSDLDDALQSSISPQFFQEPKSFRSIVEILNVVDAKANRSEGSSNLSVLSTLKENNPAYDALLEQQHHAAVVIENVVKFEHGGLNNTMETMTDVVKEYNRGREDVRVLRRSLSETTGVLTSKRNGQISMKDLWLKKVEAEESLRIMKDLEFLKETPLRLQRLMQQRRFLSAVLNLNKATVIMFGEDLVAVQGLVLVREQLMELKGTILESVVTELQSVVLGMNEDDDDEAEDDDEDEQDGHENMNTSDALEKAWARRRELQATYGGTMGPADLKELTEEKESTMHNPSSRANATMFIRFLVRAVGALGCEEDVERMLLENTANQFAAVVRRVREAAMNRKLRKIKQGVDEKKGNTTMFSHYLETLLNASVSVLQRLLFVLRLLHSMRKLRTGEVMGRYEMKEYNRKAVLELFDEIELSINKELRVHFVEKEVQAMAGSGPGGGATGASAPNGIGSPTPTAVPMGDDAEDADYKSDEPAAIFLTSASLAAPIYKKVLFFADQVNDIMVAEGVHDPKGGRADQLIDMHGSESNGPIKPASFLDAINPNKPVSILDALQAKTDALGLSNHRSSGTAGQISIMDALVATGKTDTKFSSLVLEAVQMFLEEELMPLVQLSVNTDLREIQLNPNHFSLPLTSGQGAGTEAASRALGESVPLSYATLSCASTALPLYNYWLQLPQHNDMVLTILERLVGGFKQAAREELEAKSWKLLSFEERHRGKVLGGMKRDPVMAAYRASVYDGAISIDDLLKDYGEAARASRRSSSFNAVAGSTGLGDASSIYNAELDGWGSLWEMSLVSYPTDGDKNAPQAQQGERILKDFHAIATLSSIVHGCDWLVQQLQRACAATCRQHAREAVAHEEVAVGGSVPPPPSSSPLHQHASGAVVVKKATDVLSKLGIQEGVKKTLSQAVMDEQQPLRTAVYGFCKDLSKLADDGLSVLRGEWQVVCFHFLHKLVNVRFGGSRARDEGNTSHEAEAVIAELNQHLHSFQDAALNCVSSSAVSVCLSPLAQLVPRVLMRVVQVLCSNGNLGPDADRAKPLRMIVTCQQTIVMLLEATKPNPATQQRLLDIMSVEFERVRRYVTLLDMPPKELQQWMRSNWTEYADYEFQTLWRQSVARANLDPQQANIKHQGFDEVWRDIVQKNKAIERKNRT